jgi:hypothetical protein
MLEMNVPNFVAQHKAQLLIVHPLHQAAGEADDVGRMV